MTGVALTCTLHGVSHSVVISAVIKYVPRQTILSRDLVANSELIDWRQ